MQQRSCEQIGLLLSKYIDGEASPAERQRVESHLVSCADCAARIAEYRQLASILSGSPRRDPEPALRVDLFREINRIHEEEERLQRKAQERPAWMPAPAASRRAPSRFARLWSAVSPFVAASAAVFTILGLAFFFNSNKAPQKTPQVALEYPPVPTMAARLVEEDPSGSGIQPVSTQSSKVGGLMSPVVPVGLASATAFATAMAEGLFPLDNATPVLEQSDPKNTGSWHAFRDPAFGYALSYPPNWWTYSSEGTRRFVPWWAGPVHSVPYFIEMRVEPNTRGLTAENAREELFGGKADIYRNRQGSAAWVRRTTTDQGVRYDELYSFDERNIYALRLGVSATRYWNEADAVFSQMSGTFSVASQAPGIELGYAPVLFLNGSDLFMVQPNGQSLALTHGYGVRQFALSPDMRTVVFSSAKNSTDIWASSLYRLQINGEDGSAPAPLWADVQEIHDIAWYGDREIVAIAQDNHSRLGIFRVAVPRQRDNLPLENAEPVLIRALDDTLAGARSLEVAPDRQLLTFLAPLGEHEGTDIYAVRPDGSNLDLLVSHNDPISPSDTNGRIYTGDSQAIKSYAWVNGHLDAGGYRFHLLLTCGNAASPTFFRGGFLFSAPGAMSNVLLDQDHLSIPDPNKMQIVHLAYQDGKLAMTGYYNDRNGRADVLAGLWVANVGQDGSLTQLRSMPIPSSPRGIADLQWTPDGSSLIYRETMPQEPSSLSSRYDSGSLSPFSIVKLDPDTGESRVLYSTGR